MLKYTLIGVAGLILLAVLGIVSFLAYRYYENRNIQDTNNLEEIIEKVGNNYVNSEGNVGLVIGIVKGDKVYFKGFGKTNKDSNKIPDEKTIFELASVGKIFTTSAAQILVEKGQINWDDSIDKHLNSKVKVCEKNKDATLRQLATHTAGFPSFPNIFVNKIKDELNPYKDLTTNDLYEHLASCEEMLTVGKYAYSNVGMGVLGHILELKTGKKYEEIVKEEMFNKLGLKNTTITLNDEHKQLLAQGYNQDGNPNPVWEDYVLTGAGSFLSNAEDMTKFIKANLGENQSSISTSLLKTHEKQFDGDTGFGWHYNSKFVAFITDEHDVIWHNGAAGGYNSFLAVNKQNQSGVIVLSNSANSVSSIGMRLIFSAKHISFAKQ